MGKKLSCIVLSIILVFASCLTVQAATATASLNSSSTTVKPGETFTVTLSVNCAEGINGATGITYNYDTSVLELVDASVKDTNFMNIGDTTNIDLLSNSSTKITTSNIYVFNFKVKEDAVAGKTATITTSAFSVDSDAQTDSEATVEAKSTTITVDTNNSGEEPKKDGETEPPIKPTTPENPSTQEPQEETPTENDKKGTTKTNTTTTKSTTKNTKTEVSDKKLPKAGIVTGIGITMMIAVGIAVICYVRYKTLNKKGIDK